MVWRDRPPPHPLTSRRGTFLERGEDEIIQAIEERIARWTLLPVGNGEGLQVLRYQKREKYEGHYGEGRGWLGVPGYWLPGCWPGVPGGLSGPQPGAHFVFLF